MPTNRYDNELGPESGIRGVLTYFGEGIGEILGPRIMIEDRDWNYVEIHQSKIADFLNDATGRNGKKRMITVQVEEGIFKDFKDVLSVDRDGKYKFTGESFVNKFGHFSSHGTRIIEERELKGNEEYEKYKGPKQPKG